MRKIALPLLSFAFVVVSMGIASAEPFAYPKEGQGKSKKCDSVSHGVIERIQIFTHKNPQRHAEQLDFKKAPLEGWGFFRKEQVDGKDSTYDQT